MATQGKRDEVPQSFRSVVVEERSFADVHEPVFYGSDVDAAHDAVVELFLAKDQRADTISATDEALRRLRAVLDAHLTADGVLFDSRAWIVTARWARSR
ncbi:hypothetical protein [Chelativorans sp. YIM 93263]|uniref:hypothetical protein n=1 Tax=Chelativorans sp. YIM 93263 TaxID=2906648 RepID=UPI002379584E|nr:hypothetical protein [Chelativorans sp. YIM 93263]